jgi:multidrug resistance efflux pump
MVVGLRLPGTRPTRLGIVAAGTVVALVLLRMAHSALGTVESDEARLVVPAVPVVPAAQPVVAQEYGRLGRLFVREGTAVAPGEPLFSLQRDPSVDQDLVDRGVARDLAEVNDQVRDAQRMIDLLAERIVLVRVVGEPLLQQQLRLVEQRLQRREQLWREGALSRDVMEDARERVLKLRQDLVERQRESHRLGELQSLQRLQLERWRGLLQRQAAVRQLDLQRRVAARQHPRLGTDEQASLDYATYRVPGRGVVLRLLKQPGDPVRPKETVAIWQREQQPPHVEALVPAQQPWFVVPDQMARVEIPSLRQVFSARLLSWKSNGNGILQVRFNLEGVSPSDIRRLLSLPGEPVRVQVPRRLNLVHWLQTGQPGRSLAP